jgi:hypothetical protein
MPPQSGVLFSFSFFAFRYKVPARRDHVIDPVKALRFE